MSQTATAARPVPWAPRLVPLLCFALLGGLAARRGDDTTAVATAVVSFLTGWLALILLGWLLAGSSREVGRKDARRAVTRGFFLLLPVSILALVATCGLGWDSAAAFASAGIMTASTAVSVELARTGGRGPAAVVLTLLFGTALSALWVVCTSVGVPLLMAAVERILAAAPAGGIL